MDSQIDVACLDEIMANKGVAVFVGTRAYEYNALSDLVASALDEFVTRFETFQIGLSRVGLLGP